MFFKPFSLALFFFFISIPGGNDSVDSTARDELDFWLAFVEFDTISFDIKDPGIKEEKKQELKIDKEQVSQTPACIDSNALEPETALNKQELRYLKRVKKEKEKVARNKDRIETEIDASIKGGIRSIPRIERKYGRYTQSICRWQGVHYNLILAILAIESNGVDTVTSIKGARGLMQVMPETGKRHGIIIPDSLYNPWINIPIGILVYKRYRNMLDRCPSRGTIAYNCGPGNLNFWIEVYGGIEKVKYHRKVMGVLQYLGERDEKRLAKKSQKPT